MKCFLCPTEIVLTENKHERLDVYRKKLGSYTTVTLCQKCGNKPLEVLSPLLQSKIDKMDE
jgi:uncharacterized protein with PIN domain